MLTAWIRVWGSVSLLLLVVTGPLLAQQAPQPHPWKELLGQSLDREARCRQALGWLGQDSNASYGGNLHLMQSELETLQQKLDDLTKQLNALKKEKADAAPVR
jgi:Skp family chaperone for outer membrane proteins